VTDVVKIIETGLKIMEAEELSIGDKIAEKRPQCTQRKAGTPYFRQRYRQLTRLQIANRKTTKFAGVAGERLEPPISAFFTLALNSNPTPIGENEDRSVCHATNQISFSVTGDCPTLVNSTASSPTPHHPSDRLLTFVVHRFFWIYRCTRCAHAAF
jgi:hypothetical protein